MQARLLRGLFLAAVLGVVAAPAAAQAQAWVGSKMSGSVGLDYTWVTSDKIVEDADLEFGGEPIDNHNTVLGVEFVPIDRLGINVQVPFVMAKYGGDGMPFPRHGEWDDGDYHGAFLDAALRARYMVLAEPVAIAPHIGVSIPMSDYPTVGFANGGRHLKALLTGLGIGTVIANKAFVHLNAEVTIAEKYESFDPVFEELGQMKSDFALMAGYFFTPAIEVHLVGELHQTHEGVKYSELTNPDHPLFLNHDPVLDEDWLYGGLGASWYVTQAVRISGDFRTYLTGFNTRVVKTFGAGVSYDFAL